MITYNHLPGLTTRQLEIVNGNLLGDGHLTYNKTLPKNNSKLNKTQSLTDHNDQDKLSFMKFHSNEMFPFSKPVKLPKYRSQYFFETIAHPVFTELEHKWYLRDANGNHIKNHLGYRRKIVPSDLKLTPLTVCIWFMDDGCLDAKRGSATFCTNGFSFEECHFLKERLMEDVNIKCRVKDSGKSQPLLFMGLDAVRDLIDLIRPHVEWDCFKYKLDMTPYTKVPHVGEDHSMSVLTEAVVREMFELDSQGVAQKEIAARKGVSQSTVTLVLSGQRWGHLGLGRKPKRKQTAHFTDGQIQEVLGLNREGLNQSQIAERLGRNQSTISRVLKKCQVST